MFGRDNNDNNNNNNDLHDIGFFLHHDPLRGLERMLHGIGSEGLRGMGGSSSRTRSSGGYNADVDIEDRHTHYQMTADLPGVKQEDVNLTVNDREVCLSAKRSVDGGGNEHSTRTGGADFVMRERAMGRFERCWTLPTKISEDQTAASLKDGVLTVQIAKGDAARLPIKIL